MRWIIESAKRERRKVAENDPPPVRPKTRVATARSESQAERTERAVRSVAIEPAPSMTEKQTGVTPPATAPRALPEENRVAALSAVTPPARPMGELVAKATMSRPMPPNDLDMASAAEDFNRLVPIAQESPQIWRGLCGADCEKYFYRVAFKVNASGKVDADSVRLLESNYPKLKRVVLEAVANWRYMPVQTAQEEEVVLRISGR